ncbi:DinI-like family protein [Klebsiella pneumoniae]|uniref:DinI-like family protein n=1 Tax=Klebsiella pneumoniae complex TaxID=3390273 RepID=UPI00242BA5D3|nr:MULTISPECIES: DinI-like family protein [Klebsiella]MEB2372420.1 DinI-like family protein [Klebsiella pneumoniae]
MKVELTIDRTKELPKCSVLALEKELFKRLQNQCDGCRLAISRASSDRLSVYGGEKEVENKVEEILQDTWESANDWFY